MPKEKGLIDSITEIEFRLLAATVFFLAVGFIAFTKVGLELFAPNVGVLSPYYAVASAGALLAVGLLDRSWRGLIMTAAGSAVAAVALVALAVLEAARWDVFLFALPLTVGGAAGLGMFGHGILHASAGTARNGFKIIVIGYALAPILTLVGSFFLELRRGAQEGDPQLVGLAAFAAVTIVAAVLTVIVGIEYARRRRIEA